MSRPTAVISGVVFTLTLIVSCSGKTTGGAGPPADSALSAAPTGLTAAAESGGAVRLSWKAPASSNGITGYTIYRASTSAGVYTPIAMGFAGSSYLDTGLTVQREGLLNRDGARAGDRQGALAVQVAAPDSRAGTRVLEG